MKKRHENGVKKIFHMPVKEETLKLMVLAFFHVSKPRRTPAYLYTFHSLLFQYTQPHQWAPQTSPHRQRQHRRLKSPSQGPTNAPTHSVVAPSAVSSIRHATFEPTPAKNPLSAHFPFARSDSAAQMNSRGTREYTTTTIISPPLPPRPRASANKSKNASTAAGAGDELMFDGSYDHATQRPTSLSSASARIKKKARSRANSDDEGESYARPTAIGSYDQVQPSRRSTSTTNIAALPTQNGPAVSSPSCPFHGRHGRTLRPSNAREALRRAQYEARRAELENRQSGSTTVV
ncbi:hypothetical protein CC2G_004925 [Coprinopsis cinerea AmutBmut pab1-1]|nr:hypothetical protein CC2G_004925 [Coprinopsis cinerea AmutBmut pab1-1]